VGGSTTWMAEITLGGWEKSQEADKTNRPTPPEKMITPVGWAMWSKKNLGHARSYLCRKKREASGPDRQKN